jgi:UDP-N-acetylmuramoylalanine--D-glutamate ligase
MLANELIAVTGTNGKTTTVELIGHVHRVAGLPVEVAGNVGAPLSGLAGAAAADATVVCEVSSFQLEDALQFAPEAAVLLNVAPDHLDRHGTFEAYLEAKLRVFAHQRPADLAVIPTALRGRVRPRGRVIVFGRGPNAQMGAWDGALHWRGEPLVELANLRLRGEHNVQNAMAAAAVCLARGVGREAVSEALRTFPGVTHRLEEVARIAEVTYVNDSKATNVSSTLVALRALCEPPARACIHLILGGRGKGQDFAALAEPVARACRAVYLIGEDGSAIAAALQGAGVALHDCGELERALAAARAAALPGEVVLLSPGCASFDQFHDFEERGDRFRELVARV